MKITKIYLTIFILLSSFFFILLAYEKINYAKANMLSFFGKSLSEKYELIDGDYYKFLAFCKEKIPAGKEILFYSSWDVHQKICPGDAFITFEYYKQKSRFYLYPIRTYIFSCGRKSLEYFDVSEKDINELLERISFIIVYYPDNRFFPGFKIKYKYDDTKYILAKEE